MPQQHFNSKGCNNYHITFLFISSTFFFFNNFLSAFAFRVQKRIFSSIQKLLFHSESAVSRDGLNFLLHLFLRRSQQMLAEAFPMQLKDDEPREFHPRGEKRSKLPSK